jgi:hypothetical protein
MSSTPRIDGRISATWRKFRGRILFRFRCFCYHRAHQSRHFPGSTSGIVFIFQVEWKLILWSILLTGWWRSRCKRRRSKHPSFETAFGWHACAWNHYAENGNPTNHERYFSVIFKVSSDIKTPYVLPESQEIIALSCKKKFSNNRNQSSTQCVGVSISKMKRLS